MKLHWGAIKRNIKMDIREGTQKTAEEKRLLKTFDIIFLPVEQRKKNTCLHLSTAAGQEDIWSQTRNNIDEKIVIAQTNISGGYWYILNENR